MDASPTASYAKYLAARLIAEERFEPIVLAELEPLAAQSHAMLVYSDGIALTVIALIDHEEPTSRAFTMSQEALVELGKKCLQYTGTMNGQKVPVSLMLWEVGRAPSAVLQERLGSLHRAPGNENIMISGWILDPSNPREGDRVWTTLKWYQLGTHPSRAWVKRVLASPRQAVVERGPDVPLGDPTIAKPLVTHGLLALLGAIFVGELVTARSLDPGTDTLLALGGILRGPIVEQHQWWRLASGPMLHGGIIHILMNGLCLWMAGNLLEPLLGRAWFVALYAFGALGGALLSLALNPTNVVSVGASGAIMGLFAAALVVSFKFPKGSQRSALQGSLLRVLIPSLLPLAGAVQGAHVDYAAHFGGALAGVVAGGGLWALWPASAPMPRGRRFAMVVALAGVLFAGYGALHGARGASSAGGMIPSSELRPGTPYSALFPRADEFVQQYPRDPMARYIRAMARVNAENARGAEEDIRAALSDEALLAMRFLTRQEEVSMRAILASMLQQRGEEREARRVIAPVCTVKINNQTPPQLIVLGLCD